MSNKNRNFPPVPAGWYALGLMKDLKVGETKKGVLCGKPYTIYRGTDKVIEPSGAAQRIREANGYIFAWHHPQRRSPDWHIPELDMTGWTSLIHTKLIAKSHPQEIYENSIDMAHFPLVHGFKDISVEQEPMFNSESMCVRYKITRENPVPFTGENIFPEFEVRLHGLGCAHNHIKTPSLGLSVRMIALATPTTEDTVEIHLAVAIGKEVGLPAGKVLRPILHRIASRNIVNDFSQDIKIWESKQYLSPPLLVKNDGPIGKFRSWARQFYAQPIKAEYA